MGGIVRLNAPSPLEEFLDSADEIYGSGVDGSYTVNASTTHTLQSDMFYYDLEVGANSVLNTNGYRLFVKNNLTLHDNAIIGLPGGFDGSGTLLGGGAAGTGTTNSLGGNGASATATQITTADGGSVYYTHYASQAVLGYQVTAATNGPLYLQGGAGGTGEGGGVVIVAARYIIADAGNGSQIVATGGADAGGGVVILVSTPSPINNAYPYANPILNAGGQGSGSDGTTIYLEVD